MQIVSLLVLSIYEVHGSKGLSNTWLAGDNDSWSDIYEARLNVIISTSVICQKKFLVFSDFLGFPGFRKPGNLKTSKLVNTTIY